MRHALRTARVVKLAAQHLVFLAHEVPNRCAAFARGASGLGLAISWLGRRFEHVQEIARHGGDLNHRAIEWDLVGFLDELTLIHMNGRIYDPLLARFITPDPFIQAPYNLQSYNRYSYGFNNPLRGYDPSGYSWWSDTWDDITDAVSEMVHDVVEVVKDVAHAVDENLPMLIAIGLTVATHVIFRRNGATRFSA